MFGYDKDLLPWHCCCSSPSSRPACPPHLSKLLTFAAFDVPSDECPAVLDIARRPAAVHLCCTPSADDRLMHRAAPGKPGASGIPHSGGADRRSGAGVPGYSLHSRVGLSELPLVFIGGFLTPRLRYILLLPPPAKWTLILLMQMCRRQ